MNRVKEPLVAAALRSHAACRKCARWAAGTGLEAISASRGWMRGVTSVCLSTGSWSAIAGVCSTVTCSGLPAPVANVTWATTCAAPGVGVVCAGACDAGSVGNASATCLESGNWSSTTGGCTVPPVTCPTLPPPSTMWLGHPTAHLPCQARRAKRSAATERLGLSQLLAPHPARGALSLGCAQAYRPLRALACQQPSPQSRGQHPAMGLLLVLHATARATRAAWATRAPPAWPAGP